MDRRMFNEEMEAILPPDRKRLENALLKPQIAHVYANSRMYRQKFAGAKMTAGDIRGIEDLFRLPFTTKAELRESQERRPPFGDYLAVSPEAVRRVHRTSGTTGKFIYTALTREDLDLTHDCGARAFWAAGLRPHHRVIHCLNYCMWMGGYTDHASLENTGAAVIPFGVGNSRQLVRVIQEAGITAISSTPSYPKVLAPVVREELNMEPAGLGLRLGLFGGEPGLENPVFRGQIERTWDIKARNANYGVSDVLCNFASECPENGNLHFLAQGALLLQLIDPSTGADLQISEGTVGEMVLTHLRKAAQPLIRYRTADLLEIMETGRCDCGRTGFRFRVVGRADDMLHVKGVNVFPNGVAMVLAKKAPDVTGEFQIVVTHPPPYDHLTIRVEHGAGILPEETAGLKESVETMIREELNFRADVEMVPPGAIPRTEMGKALRVVRNY